MKIQGLIYWGYIDTDGIIYVKRYTNDRVIENFERLPFVAGIFDPFYAYDMAEARQKIESKYREIINQSN